MSCINDTHLRTREAAARLVAAGRHPHELTVDLIYAEIRQGSRTTIDDELKLWKDEQARNNDALSAALPPAVANAMLSVWALAVAQGEQVFAQRSAEFDAEAAAATTRAESLQVANAGLKAEVQTLRAQVDYLQARLATALAGHARVQTQLDAAIRQAEAAVAERDAVRAQSDQALHEAQSTHARELEAVRAARAEHEAALRAEVDQATARLEGVQTLVMLRTGETREAQRRAEAAVSRPGNETSNLWPTGSISPPTPLNSGGWPNGMKNSSLVSWKRANCGASAIP